MKSLLRVIKPNLVVQSEDVVVIPDNTKESGKKQPNSDEQENDEFCDTDSNDINDMDDEDIQDDTELDPEQRAAKEAQNMIEKAKRQCEQMIKDAVSEAEQIKKYAKEQAYAEQKEKILERSQNLDKEVENTLDEMQKAQNNYFRHYKKELKYLALDIAEKVLQKTVAEDDMALNDLVKQTLSTIKNADWVTVEMSEKLVKLVEKLRSEFSQDTRNIDIVPLSKPEDNVVVKTSDGIIDASVSVQLNNIKDLFVAMDRDAQN